MASYSRLGNYLLATELGSDPFGKIYRGLTLTGTGFERHVLIRTFAQEIMDAGLYGKTEEINRTLAVVNGQRFFGQGYRLDGGRQPHLVCEYIPGRNLAQMLEKTRQEQMPLGVDHALAILQGVAQALVHLHTKGLRHGILHTNSVWISFEGAAHLLDAPFAPAVSSLLPRCRTTMAALSRYRTSANVSSFQQDLYALGAIFYELLTLEPLPEANLLESALAKATLKAAQEEDEKVPSEIMALLRRLLGLDRPFDSPHNFNAELERVLYDGEHSPTTFNMAFYMHTIFRDENEEDLQAMKEDQGADFAPFLDFEPEQRSLFETESGRSYSKYVYVGAAVALTAISLFGYRFLQAEKEKERIQAEMAQLQKVVAESESRMKDLTNQETAVKKDAEATERALKDARTETERARIRKEKEEQERKLAEIKAKKEAAQKAQAQVQQATQQLAERVKNISPLRPTPAPVKPIPAPTPEPERPKPDPTPAPVEQAKQPEPTPEPTPDPTPQPTPVATQPSQPSPSTFNETPDSPPKVTRQARPAINRVVNKDFLPPALRYSEIKVSVKVYVDAQGRPLKASVDRGIDGNFPYNDAAKDAAYKSNYAPATKGGKPVNAWLTVEYNFGRPR